MVAAEASAFHPIAEIQTKRLEAEGPPRTAARQLSHRGRGPGPLVPFARALSGMGNGAGHDVRVHAKPPGDSG